MKKAFNKFLFVIDDYFAPKEEQEKRVLYLMPGILIFILCYLFVFPYIDSWIVQKEAVHADVYSAFQKSQIYIQDIDRSGGIQAREVIVQKSAERLAEAESKAKKAEATLAEVYALSRAWYFTLDYAMREATKLGIEILASSLGKSEEQGVGGLEKSWMNISGRGSKQAIMNYIYLLEHEGRFVSLEKISLAPKGGMLEFEIFIENQKGSL